MHSELNWSCVLTGYGKERLQCTAVKLAHRPCEATWPRQAWPWRQHQAPQQDCQ